MRKTEHNVIRRRSICINSYAPPNSPSISYQDSLADLLKIAVVYDVCKRNYGLKIRHTEIQEKKNQ